MAGAAVNPSPLIFLARLGRLEALSILKPVRTTDEVLREVKAGAAKGFPDWVPVDRAVKDGSLEARSRSCRARLRHSF